MSSYSCILYRAQSSQVILLKQKLECHSVIQNASVGPLLTREKAQVPIRSCMIWAPYYLFPNTLFLFTLHGPHWLSCCTLNIPGTPQPQDQYHRNSFFLAGSPPRFLQSSTTHCLLVFVQMTLFKQILPGSPSLKLQLPGVWVAQ